MPRRAPRAADAARPDGPGWTYFGFADDTPEMNAPAAETGQPCRARRASSRWKTAASAASCSAASRPQRSELGDRDGRRGAESQGPAPPKPRCAASGRPIAGTWAVSRATDRWTSRAGRAQRRLCRASTTIGWRNGRGFSRILPLQGHHGGERRRGPRGRHHLCRHRAACWRTASPRCAKPTSTSASAIATSSGCRSAGRD